jgi:hypothetical protein
MSDVPLPYCPECGWVAPSDHVRVDGYDAWGYLHRGYYTGPINWRDCPEFRCGCRIVHEAREKGLIDEACGGHGPAQKEWVRTMGELIHRKDMRVAAAMEARRQQRSQEACGGHGPGPWTIERLVDARLKQAIEELKKVVMPDFWDWGPGRLRSAREETMVLDAKIEANRKLYEGRQW